jgi:hypothetical protein
MAHAMVRLAMDGKLRDSLARGARRTAEALDWEGELDRLGASYREVCLAHASSATKQPASSPTFVVGHSPRSLHNDASL